MAGIFSDEPPELIKNESPAFISPVTGTMGGGYGDSRSHGQHAAGDLMAPAGAPVIAPGNMKFLDGRQGGTNLRDNDWWSHWEDIDTGMQYRFAHHGDVSGFRPGDVVSKGDQWNVVGSAINGPHLHMAVHDPVVGKNIDWITATGLKRGHVVDQGAPFLMTDFEKRTEKIAAKVSENKGTFSDEPPQIGVKGAFSDTPPTIGLAGGAAALPAGGSEMPMLPEAEAMNQPSGLAPIGQAIRTGAEALAQGFGKVASGAPYVEMAHGRQESIQPEEIAAAEKTGTELARGVYRDASLGLIQPPDVPGPQSGEQRREAEVAHIIRTAGGYLGMTAPLTALTKAGVVAADLYVPEGLGTVFNKILGTGLGFGAFGGGSTIGESAGQGAPVNAQQAIDNAIDAGLLGAFLTMGGEGVAAAIRRLMRDKPGPLTVRPDLNPDNVVDALGTLRRMKQDGSLTEEFIRGNRYMQLAVKLDNRFGSKSTDEIIDILEEAWWARQAKEARKAGEQSAKQEARPTGEQPSPPSEEQPQTPPQLGGPGPQEPSPPAQTTAPAPGTPPPGVPGAAVEEIQPATRAPVSPQPDLTRPASGPLFTDEQLQGMTHEEFDALPPEQQKKFKEDLKAATQRAQPQTVEASETPPVKPEVVRKGKGEAAAETPKPGVQVEGKPVTGMPATDETWGKLSPQTKEVLDNKTLPIYRNLDEEGRKAFSKATPKEFPEYLENKLKEPTPPPALPGSELGKEPLQPAPAPAKEPWEMTMNEFNKEFWLHGRGFTHPRYGQKTTIGGITKSADEARAFAGVRTDSNGPPSVGEISLIRSSDIPPYFSEQIGNKQSYAPIRSIDWKVYESIPGNTKDPHRFIVEKALVEGRPVPASVLADYPDLAQGKAEAAPVAKEPAAVTEGVGEEKQTSFTDRGSYRTGPTLETSQRRVNGLSEWRVSRSWDKELPPKEQKQFALAAVDEALKNISKETPGDITGKPDRIVVDIPGDGEYRIANNRDALEKMRKAFEKFPVGTVKQETYLYPSTKPTGNRPKVGEDIEYVTDYIPRKGDIVVKKPSPEYEQGPGWANGYYADGTAMIKMDKPKAPLDDRTSKRIPEYIDRFSKTKATPGIIEGEYNAFGSDFPLVMMRSGDIRAGISAKYVDAILTQHPDAKPFLTEDDGMVVFRKGKEFVAAVMPINKPNLARFDEMKADKLSEPAPTPPAVAAQETAAGETQAEKGGVKQQYSAKQVPRVYIFHSIKDYNLDEIIKTGGISVAPSIGISKDPKQAQEFGDIIFLGSPDTIAKTKSNIFERDIWSPTIKDIPERLIFPVKNSKAEKALQAYGILRDSGGLKEWIKDATGRKDPAEYVRQYGLMNDEKFYRTYPNIARRLGLKLDKEDPFGDACDQVSQMLFEELAKTPKNMSDWLKLEYGENLKGVGSMFKGAQMAAGEVPLASLGNYIDRLSKKSFDKDAVFKAQWQSREKVRDLLKMRQEEHRPLEIWPTDELAGELAGAKTLEGFKRVMRDWNMDPALAGAETLPKNYGKFADTKWTDKKLTKAWNVLKKAYVDIPSEYFEAKTLEPISINEFPEVHIPKDRPELVDKLKQAGFKGKIKTYGEEFNPNIIGTEFAKGAPFKYSVKPKEIQGEKLAKAATGATASQPLDAPLGNQNYPESPEGRKRQVADIKSVLERTVSQGEYRRFWDGIEHSESLRVDPELAPVVKLAAKFGIKSVVAVKGAGFNGVLIQAADGPVMLIDQDTSIGMTKTQVAGHEIFHHLVENSDPNAIKLVSMVDPKSPVFKQYQHSLDMVNGRTGSASVEHTANEIAADYYGGILTRTLADGSTIKLKDAFQSPLRAFGIKTRITSQAKQGVQYMAKRGPPPTLKTVSDALKGPVSLVFPTTMSKEHLKAAEILGSKLGQMNRRQEASNMALQKPSLAFVKKGVHNPKTPLTENPGMEFASDMSQGRPMTSFPVPQRSPLLRIAEKVQAGLEKRLILLEKADASLETVRENYFPGMWTPESIRAFNQAMDEAIWTQNLGLDPNGDVLAANGWLPADREWVKNRTTELLKKNQGSDKSALSYLTRRPFKGKESFRKAKVFDDIMTAVEFGLVPISPNPIDLVKLKYAEMDRSIMANQAIQDYKAKGLVQFNHVSKKTPEGWVPINDKYGTVYGPYDPEQGFRPIYGHWIATEPVADILNHYLSSSAYNNRYFGGLYKGFMSLGNMLNQAQLGGLSLFHAGFTSFEVQCSALAEVIKDIYGLARGNRSIGQIGRTIARFPFATIGTSKSGAVLRNEWNFPGIDFPVNIPINQLPQTPEAKLAMIAKAMELSGAGLKMERGLRTGQLDKLIQNWYGGRKALAALRSPLAFVELGAKPILDFLVPRQKAGVFAHLAERLLEQNPDKTLNELIPQIRQIWNRTDERLGQVRYDRIFANNIAKNVIQLVTRAPGWTGGTISAFAGAPKDLGKFFYEWAKTGKAPQDIPDRVAYLIALAILVVGANGLMTYALTGEKPKGMDYLAFRDGGKDKYGNPTRFLFPTYAKDIYAYIQDPLHTLLAKTHPIIALIGDQIRNRNYYNEMITDKPFSKSIPDRFMAILGQFEPFWTRGARKISEQQGGVLETLKTAPQKIAAPLVGTMPATRAYTATDAMKMMDGFQELRGRRTTTPQEASLNKEYRSIVDMYRRGDVKGAEKAEKQLVSEKKITREALDNKLNRSGVDVDSSGNVTVQLPQINMFKGLTFLQAVSVWDVATPEEKKILADAMDKKLTNFSKTEASDDYEKDISRIEQEIDKVQGVR